MSNGVRNRRVWILISVVAMSAAFLVPTAGVTAQEGGAGAGAPSDPTDGGRLTPVVPDYTGPLPGIDFSIASGAPSEVPFVFPEVPLGVVGQFNFEEPLIRVNPTNPANIVATSHRGMRISTDGGATWGALITFPNIGASNGDTAMDFDSQGRLFWANLGGVLLEVTQMNPLTGAQIGVTATLGANSDDKEFLAADPYPASPSTDNLYMISTRFAPSPNHVFFMRSTDQGVNWTAGTQLSAAGEGFPWPADVGVAPNGDVYAAYHAGGSSGAVGTTWVLRSTDGGQTFPQKNLAFTAGQSDVTSNNPLAPDFDTQIPQTAFWMQGSWQPWVLADPVRPDHVYIVSNDDPDNTHGVGDDADVVISRSTDGGVTWNVSTIPDGGGTAAQVFPFAAIDETSGNIAVAWYDTRRGLTNAGGNLLLDVFATFSTDGGVTWAPAFMINDPGNPFDPEFPGNQRRWPTPQQVPCLPATEVCRIGEYFGIDISGNAIHLDWIGNTRSGPGPGNVTGDQLYYSRVQISEVDAYEPNDTLGTAAVLGSVPQLTLNGLSLHNANDVDWFRVTAPASGMMAINALFSDAAGDIDIRVTDALGNAIANATSVTDNEQIVIPVVNQERYFLEVFGFGGAVNTYDLEIETFPAPIPSTPDLDAAADSGGEDDDNVTADNTPTFFVQADLGPFAAAGIVLDNAPGTPGADVWFIADSLTAAFVSWTTAAPVSPAPGSQWTATFGGLPDGAYAVSAYVQMEDGQGTPAVGRGPLGDPLIVTIDTLPPAPPSVPDLLASSDSGPSAVDNYTAETEPAFSGTGEANAEVRIFDNPPWLVPVGDGDVTAAGNWEITVEPLVPGSYQVRAEQEDRAGNVSPQSGVLAPVLTIDTTGPQRPTIDLPAAADTGASSSDNVTNWPGPIPFQVTADVGTAVVVKDGNTVVDVFTSTGLDVRFLALAEGTHPLSVESTDTAGNVSHQAEELAVHVDRTAPSIPAAVDMAASSDTGVSDSDDVTSIATPAFQGVVFGTLGDAPLKVFLWDGANLVGGTDILVDFPVPSDARAFEITSEPLRPGGHSISAAAADAAGNVSALSPPLAVTILTPVDLEITKTESADPVIAGSGTGNLVYTVTVTNNGPEDATGVKVVDNIVPGAGVTVDSVVVSKGITLDFAAGSEWSIGDLAAGASETLTMTLTVGSGVPAGTDVIANAAEIVSFNEDDTNLANNAASEKTSVAVQADLMVSIADAPDPVGPADTLTYTVAVKNNGPSDAHGGVSTVTLPADVAFVATSGCPTDPGGIPACALGTIAAGATASYTVTTKVTTFLPGTLTFSAVATSTTPLVNLADDTGTETTTVELQQATVGLFDPDTAIWYLADSIGEVTTAGFGNPGDLPVVGDWDGNESDTVGLYRPTDGFFYGRNRNTSGIAEFTCFAGNPEDMAVSGDWDGDGTDTLGLYRPSEQKFYLFNKVCVGAPMGAAGISFAFGNPGDLPLAGDFDGDGSAEVGLFRQSTGFVYYRNTLTAGIADVSFYWGNPDDLVVSGDWNANGTDTPGLYRPSDITFYLRNTNTEGVADLTIPFPGGQSDWLAVAGSYGLG